jgi:hypothetical protein
MIAASPSAAWAVGDGPPAFLSAADKAMVKEDIGIINRRVHIVRDDDPDAKADRLASCVTYWEANLHRNRPADVRYSLMGIRVARCMFRTNYTVIDGPCKPVQNINELGWKRAIGTGFRGECYAKFDRVLATVAPIR